MNKALRVGIGLVSLGFLGGSGCSKKEPEKLNAKPPAIVTKPKKLTLEDKLEVLKSGGFAFRDANPIDHLLGECDRSVYEKGDYKLIMSELCAPRPPCCRNLIRMDFARIEEDGDYVEAIQPLLDVMRGSVKITNLKDHVDPRKEAWISYNLDGKNQKFKCKLKDDWFDISLIPHFAKILRAHDSHKILAAYDMNGYDPFIVSITRNQLKKLNENGIAFEEVK